MFAPVYTRNENGGDRLDGDPPQDRGLRRKRKEKSTGRGERTSRGRKMKKPETGFAEMLPFYSPKWTAPVKKRQRDTREREKDRDTDRMHIFHPLLSLPAALVIHDFLSTSIPVERVATSPPLLHTAMTTTTTL